MNAAHLLPFALLTASIAACSKEPAAEPVAAAPVKLHYYSMGPT